jgi:exonuclease SbcC
VQAEKVDELKAKINRLESEVSVISHRLEEFISNLKEAQEAQDLLDTKDYAHEERTRLEEIGPVEYNPEQHKDVRKRLEKLKGAGEDYARLMEIYKRQETLGATLEESDAKIKELQERITALDDEISTTLDEQGTSEDELRGEIAGLHKNADNLENTKLRSARQSLAMWQEKAKRRRELKEEIDKLRKDRAENDQKLAVSKALVEAVGKKGAPALIIESFLPTIERDANAYLELMSPGISLTLDSQRITQKGSASETLDINVYNNGHSAPIETLSGGERFRADLALRLAIGRALSRKSGTQARMLCIDEGFGSQDPDGQEAVVGTIINLSDAFDLIVLITHVEPVAKAISTIGSVLEVGKSRGASTLG